MFIRWAPLLFLTPCPISRQMAGIKTFAFIDLETTGLPHLENNKTRITELTIMTVQSEHLSLGVVPRVQNKLTLCFNPQKLISIDSERITGLSNFDLEHMAPFTQDTVDMINSFLKHSPRPICLVAHNGNRFDYPILRTEIEKTGSNLLDSILCVDSLEAFRQLSSKPAEPVPIEFQDGFDELLCKVMDEYELGEQGINKALEVQKINETTPVKLGKPLNTAALHQSLEQPTEEPSNVASSPRKRLGFSSQSFKLVDVYQRLTKRPPMDAHQAEKDVIMLAMCAATLGDCFIDWANVNAQNFASGPKMGPGRRLGT